jgi:hypothetical protein
MHVSLRTTIENGGAWKKSNQLNSKQMPESWLQDHN